MADEEFRLCCGSHCSPEALNHWGLYLTAQLTLDKMQAVPTLGELFLGQCMLEFWFLSADFSSPPLPQRSHLQWGSKAVYTGGYSLLGCKSVPLTLFRGKRQKPSISAFQGKRQKPSDINLCFPEHFCCRPCAGQQTGPRTGQAQVLPLRNVHTTVLPEVVLVLRTMWVQVGGVALLGGDPTVNMTARELAPLPMDGVAIAIP